MTSTHERVARTGRLGGPGALLTTLVLVVVVVALVSSLGAPLLPRIAAERGVSPDTAQWTLTVALLAGAVATPVLGRLGDGPRRRGVILGALGLVAVGCLLAVPDAGIGLLVAGRALQGLGLGLMPLAMAVARDHLPDARVRRAVMLLSVTTVVGAGIGYPISGGLALAVGIGGSYLAGAVLVLGSLVLAAVVLPPGRHLDPRPLDLLGAVLLGGGVAAALLAVSRGGSWGWTSPPVAGLAAGAAVLLVLWCAHELRAIDPLVDLRLLRHHAVLVANTTAVAAGIGTYLLMSTVSWLVQSPSGSGSAGLGRSALVAACAMVPFSVLSVVATRVVSKVSDSHADTWSMPFGCGVFALAMVLLGISHDSLFAVFVLMGFAGFGAGCTFSSMPSTIVGSVPRHEVGSAVGFNQVLRVVGYSTGSAVGAAVLATYADPRTGATPAAGFETAAVVGIVVFLVAAVVALALGLPARLGGRREPSDELLSEP